MLPTGVSFSPGWREENMPRDPASPPICGICLLYGVLNSPFIFTPLLLLSSLFSPSRPRRCEFHSFLRSHSLFDRAVAPYLPLLRGTPERTIRSPSVRSIRPGRLHFVGTFTLPFGNTYSSCKKICSIFENFHQNKYFTTRYGSSFRISLHPHSRRDCYPKICSSATGFGQSFHRWITRNRCNRSSIWPIQFHPGWTNWHRPHLNSHCNSHPRLWFRQCGSGRSKANSRQRCTARGLIGQSKPAID